MQKWKAYQERKEETHWSFGLLLSLPFWIESSKCLLLPSFATQTLSPRVTFPTMLCICFLTQPPTFTDSYLLHKEVLMFSKDRRPKKATTLKQAIRTVLEPPGGKLWARGLHFISYGADLSRSIELFSDNTIGNIYTYTPTEGRKSENNAHSGWQLQKQEREIRNWEKVCEREKLSQEAKSSNNITSY